MTKIGVTEENIRGKVSVIAACRHKDKHDIDNAERKLESRATTWAIPVSIRKINYERTDTTSYRDNLVQHFGQAFRNIFCFLCGSMGEIITHPSCKYCYYVPFSNTMLVTILMKETCRCILRTQMFDFLWSTTRSARHGTSSIQCKRSKLYLLAMH